MATHHPASTDAPVVPVGSGLTLSEVEHDGHHSDPLDLASLEHAFTVLEAERAEILELDRRRFLRVKIEPEWLSTVEVALAAVYAEICRRSTQSETVAGPEGVRERIMAGLRVVGPVTMPRSDYGADLVTRARLARYVGADDYDAPTGAGESVEASRG